MHRKSRDEQHMIIFVLPGLNGGTFLYYNNGGSFPNTKTRVDPVREREAAQDKRTNIIVTVIYLQIFEGASPYTGGRSIISVEMELLCVLYARY